MNQPIKITEIFYSLQGEATLVGLPTVFIRLTGCPLRCQYCDTAYAFSKGSMMSIDQIMQEVARYKTQYVTVTGGEPLAQKPCLSLLTVLCNQGYTVSLETSGALDVSTVDPRVIKIVDIKTPGSLEVARNRFENVNFLTSQDQIKFVICDEADYHWSKQVMAEYQLTQFTVLFSPSYTQLKPEQLAEWIPQDQLPVRFQLQLHKQIWGDCPGK